MKNLIQCIILIVCILSGSVTFSGCGMKGELTQAEETAASDDVTSEEGVKTDETSAVSSSSGSESAESSVSTGKTVYVYVCGAVENSGVYELSADARVYEAVEAAGGMTEEAAEGEVNLAEPVTDGMQVKIPTFGEVYVEEKAALTGTDSDGRINLNTATAEQLMTLPGIGESKANAIISYRETNGGFSQIEDIMNISGIKEGLFEQIETLICV